MRNPLIFCWLLFLSLGGPLCSHSQCPTWPADCPGIDYTELDPVEDSLDKLGNPLVPQEVAMEHRLRGLMTGFMNQVAEKEHWKVVELTEGGSSGYRDLPPHDTPLNYALRPPHWFEITFQVIVDKDSLAAWSTWLKDFSTRRLASVNKYSDIMAARQEKNSAYMDSANYYGMLKANYMTTHIQGYQQALMAGNKSSAAAYEKAVDAYDHKINAWVNRATDLQKDPGSEMRESNADEEKKSVGLSYRDAAVLLVEFEFNIKNAFVEA